MGRGNDWEGERRRKGRIVLKKNFCLQPVLAQDYIREFKSREVAQRQKQCN